MNLKHRVRRLEHNRRANCPVCHGKWLQYVWHNSPFRPDEDQPPPEPCPGCGDMTIIEFRYVDKTKSRPAPFWEQQQKVREALQQAPAPTDDRRVETSDTAEEPTSDIDDSTLLADPFDDGSSS